MERTQFTFYESFFKAISRIKKKTDRADAYDIICRYALLQEEPDLDSVSDSVAIAFELLRPVLDKAKERAESGKRGGSKPKNSSESGEANPKQNESKTEANGKLPAREKEKEEEKEEENENENEIENDSVYGASAPTRAPEQQDEFCQKAKRFNRPTVQEVADYCRERGNQVDAQRFVDYYTANGWRVGKNPMKDWKAAVRTWEKQEGLSPAPVAPRWGKPEIPKGASGQLGEAELEAIQRVLREN